MDDKPTFKDIENHREIYTENELFIQYVNRELSDRYDANCMLLKFSPTLPEFKIIEQIQMDTQLDLKHKHIKFLWPENIGLMPNVLDYIDKKEYKIGMLNLYFVTQDLFRDIDINKDLEIIEVTKNHFDDFVRINLEEDSIHGSQFVAHKEKMYPFQFELEYTTFLLGYVGDEPVGSMILNESDHFLEIDNVLTISDFRNKKVASTLLNYIVKKYSPNKDSIILVADAEDSVKEMYEQLGFQFVSYQISAEKEISFT